MNTVIVADTDTGMDYNHPDLSTNVWINQAGIPANRLPNLTDVNGDGVITFYDLNQPVNQGPGKITDTDGDGVITAADVLAPENADETGGWGDGSTQTDLIGWNFVNNTNNPMDDNGHGTHTAGIIGAVGNNLVGVAGSNWNVQIMPVKFLDFTTPVAITAGATYIASYFAPVGHFVDDTNYFASSGVTNGPLTALSNSAAGGNGVYLYGTSGGFPTNSYQSSNYWVDVVFSTTTDSTAKPSEA
ncbi:MAG: DUF4082 domain-containing protein [Isosphaerales bacterium]